MYGGKEIHFQDPQFEHKVHADGSFMHLMFYQNPPYHTCYIPNPLITPAISGEQYSCDACKLNTSLHPPATSFLLAPDIPFSILFSHSLFAFFV